MRTATTTFLTLGLVLVLSAPALAEVDCTDGIDNDGDLLIDCADPSCDLLPCNDGLFCNVGETCQASVCAGGTPAPVDDGVACTDDSCDEVNDVIVNTPNNANCDDGLFCNGAETCDALLGCQAGTPPAVDDGVACTDDSCDEVNDVIVNTPNNANCDDGLFCNGAETCDALLGCQAGTPPVVDDGVPCTDDSCDEVNDIVVNAPNNANCDDGAFCNGAETCDALLGCQAGTNPCGVLTCDEIADVCTGCLLDADCDNGAFCDGVETCVANVCVPGTAVNCADAVACTVDACNEVTDACDNTANDAACDDGAFCNGAETCDVLLGCQAGTNPCGVLTCDEITDVCTGCAVDAECDNGAFCDGAETCVATVCVPGTVVNCADAVTCTADACNEATDACDNTPNNALCADPLFCNGTETCDAVLGCQAGTPPVVDDGVSCTTDFCDEPADIVRHTPSNASCTDGLFCTGAETCNPVTGCVSAAPVNCSALTGPCSNGVCDEATDRCVRVPLNEGLPCDDGDSCTATDICTSGFCAGGGAVCGDGVIDPSCSETCEPTLGVQLCDSQFDEDGDGLIACADPDCCEDLVTPSCGANCQVANYCKPILNDPSVLKIRVTEPDFYKIHGRVNVNPATWNPLVTGFTIILSNPTGVIYRSTLAGSDLRYKGVQRYIWKDRSAKNGLGLRNGLELVRMKVTKDIDTGGLFFAHIKVKAYGDFSAAIEPDMTTQFLGVEDTAILTATWTQRRGGWILRAADQLVDSGNFQCVTGP